MKLGSDLTLDEEMALLPEATAEAQSTPRETPRVGGSSYPLLQKKSGGLRGAWAQYRIAFLVTAGLHASLALTGGHARAKPTTKPLPEPIALTHTLELDAFEVPPLEAAPEDSVMRAPSAEMFAPPQQMDVPVATIDAPFIQRVQPVVQTGRLSGLTLLPSHYSASTGGVANGGKIFDVLTVDQAPEVRMKTPPQYPSALRKAGVTGEVVVTFVVDARGEVESAEIVRSSHPAFEHSALQSIRTWKFKPGRKAGRSVATRMEQPITFAIYR